MVKSLKNKDDISLKYINTLPNELQNLLLIDDRVKEFNKIKEDNKEEDKIINEIDNNKINLENEKTKTKKNKKNQRIRFIENEINDNNNDVKYKRVDTLFNLQGKSNNLALEENKDAFIKRTQNMNKTTILKKKKKINQKRGKRLNTNNNKDESYLQTENLQKNISMKNLNLNAKSNKNNRLKINDMRNIIDEDFKEMTNIIIPKKSSKKPFGNIKFENSKNNRENKLENNEQTKLKGTNRKLLD